MVTFNFLPGFQHPARRARSCWEKGRQVDRAPAVRHGQPLVLRQLCRHARSAMWSHVATDQSEGRALARDCHQP